MYKSYNFDYDVEAHAYTKHIEIDTCRWAFPLGIIHEKDLLMYANVTAIRIFCFAFVTRRFI